MRYWELFEDVQNPLRIRVTKRFTKDYWNITGYKQGEKVFREFLEFKTANPRQPFGDKDGITPDTPLSRVGAKRVHLVKGKLIVVYSISQGALILYASGNHDMEEGARAVALARYIETLTMNDLTPYELPKAEEVGLSTEEIEGIKSLIYEMAVQDTPILQAILQGQFAQFFEFTQMAIEEHHPDWDAKTSDAAVIRAFGGEDALRKFIAQVLKQYGH
jgi:hypothetical protein